MSDMREQMKIDLRLALKARDQTRTSTLRALLAEFDHAEAVEVSEEPAKTIEEASQRARGHNEAPRRELTAVDLQTILHTELAERQAVLHTYQQQNRPDEVARLEAEIAIIAQYVMEEG